jgi:hypothetical protein
VQPYEGKRKGIWALQVYRSLSSAHWAPPDRKPKDDADKAAFASVTWKQGVPAAGNSIQLAYQQAIAQAEKFIYIENQYLIGSGRRWQGAKSTINNDIPGCIVDRILAQAKAGKPFCEPGMAARKVWRERWPRLGLTAATGSRQGGCGWSVCISPPPGPADPEASLVRWHVRTRHGRAHAIGQVGQLCAVPETAFEPIQ